jgi:hypothetical protein
MSTSLNPIEERIVLHLRTLPDELVEEVNDFIEFLADRYRKQSEEKQRYNLDAITSIFSSGRGDVSANVERILAENLDSTEGWKLP